MVDVPSNQTQPKQYVSDSENDDFTFTNFEWCGVPGHST